MIESSLVRGRLVLQSYPSSDIKSPRLALRPVLICLLLVLLLECGDHHQYPHLLLQDHLPEVLKRVRLGGDGGNEFLLDVSKLDRGGINVGDRGFTLTKLLAQLLKVLRYSLTDDFIKSNQVVIVRNYNILFVNYGAE